MNRLRILTGDCRDILPTLEAGSVQCCVSSPPYWGLRDYGTNGQLGLEATPEEYIANMVTVFRAVRRVLRDDGTLWLNMGDSYATSNPAGRRDSGNGTSQKFGDHEINGSFGASTRANTGLKPKDLCMMPARLAMALQADGWYLRSEIVWHKPNPMPESVPDRPTKAHEMIYLLAKEERYFYDAEAIREPSIYPDDDRKARSSYDDKRFPSELIGGIRPGNGTYVNRNKRSVWTISTQPYVGAHFATFPEDLIKPCIMAGSRVGDLVLDPFGGSGTTAKVGIELGRRAVLIELNPAYVQLAHDRTNVTPGWF